MPPTIKTSVTLREDLESSVREIAAGANVTMSEVMNRALEQMAEMIDSDESAPNLTPWTRLFREQVRQARKKKKYLEVDSSLSPKTVALHPAAGEVFAGLFAFVGFAALHLAVLVVENPGPVPLVVPPGPFGRLVPVSVIAFPRPPHLACLELALQILLPIVVPRGYPAIHFPFLVMKFPPLLTAGVPLDPNAAPFVILVVPLGFFRPILMPQGGQAALNAIPAMNLLSLLPVR